MSTIIPCEFVPLPERDEHIVTTHHKKKNPQIQKSTILRPGSTETEGISALCQKVKRLSLAERQKIIFPSNISIDWDEMIGEWCVQERADGLGYVVRLKTGQEYPLSQAQLHRLSHLLATYEKKHGDPASSIFQLPVQEGGVRNLQIVRLVTFGDVCDDDEPGTGGRSFSSEIQKIAPFALMMLGLTTPSAALTVSQSPSTQLTSVSAPFSFGNALADMCPVVNNFSVCLPPLPSEVYPNKLKNRNFINAESPRFDSEKTSPLLEVDINQVVEGQPTAVTSALFRNDYDRVSYLLSHGADSNQPDCYGRLPLCVAAIAEAQHNFSCDFVGLLLQHGADPNRYIPGANSPLTDAIAQANSRAVKHLLHAGADPNKMDGAKDFPLYRAIFLPTPDIAELLLQNGADINLSFANTHSALTVAIEHGNLMMVNFLLQHKADPNVFDGAGTIPLEQAYASKIPNQSTIVTSLLENGANLTVASRYSHMKTAALCWTLDGFIIQSTPIGNCRFNLEGRIPGITPPILHSYVRRFLQSRDPHSTMGLSPAERDSILETMEHMYPFREMSAAEIATRIISGRPFFIVKEFLQSDHTVAFVFHKNRVMVCDRGWTAVTDGVRIYSVSLDLLTEDFFTKFLSTKDQSVGASLLQTLEPKLIDTIEQKHSKVGNCPMASPKSGFLAVLYTITESHERARAIYKLFSTMTRTQSLPKYLSSCGPGEANKDFLEKTKVKILESHRFDVTTKDQLLGMVNDAQCCH